MINEGSIDPHSLFHRSIPDVQYGGFLRRVRREKSGLAVEVPKQVKRFSFWEIKSHHAAGV